MEVKFNVAAILKDKPKGTKLYDYLHNIDVEFNDVETTEIETSIWCTREKGGYNELFGYSKLGTLRGWLDGLQILLPSKEMRDWRKFVWKKGDVLISNDGKKEVFFNGFTDDTYALFKAKHGFEVLSDGNTIYLADEDGIATSDYTLETEEAAKTYINTIEERLGGKLNREILEVEKAQPEFNDGDIAFADYGNRQDVFIVSDKTNLSEGYDSFISLDLRGTLSMGYRTSFFKKDLCKLRLATEEEKQQLFEALAKEGKAWDREKKAIVDLKPKVELKPFDKVLIRDDEDHPWRVSLFGYKDANSYYCCNGCTWNQCIPYEGNEHLLGTTKDVEG